MKVKRQLSQKGFTLIELLVSVTILALLMLMMTQIFDSFSKTFRSGMSSMQTYDDVRTLSLFLTKDLTSTMRRVNSGREQGIFVQANTGLSYTNSDAQPVTIKKGIFFTFPDERIRSLKTMSFVTHSGILWSENRGEIYRFAYNTEIDNSKMTNSPIAVSTNMTSFADNFNRLTEMTKVYKLGLANWVGDADVQGAISESVDLPLIRNVYAFEVDCVRADGTVQKDTWAASEPHLPRFLRINFGVADDNDAPLFEREIAAGAIKSTNRLRYFSVTVPFPNYGVNDNRVY